MKITPRKKYVLVKPEETSEKENKFGLLTPSNVEQEQKAFGEVVSVGKEVTDIKKGDRVIYGAYAGENVKTPDSKKDFDFKLLHDDDIIAFIG